MKYNNTILCLDCETGGLCSVLKKQATLEVALTELAIVAIDNETLEIVDKFSCLFKPYKKDLIYEPKALEVSHITLDMLDEDGIEMKDAFSQIESFIKKHTKGKLKPIMAGHNVIKFDLDFIVGLFELNKKSAEDYFDDFILDTLQLSRLKLIEAPKFNLASCLQTHQIDIVEL